MNPLDALRKIPELYRVYIYLAFFCASLVITPLTAADKIDDIYGQILNGFIVLFSGVAVANVGNQGPPPAAPDELTGEGF